MDFLAITSVLLIAGIHYSYGLKIRKLSTKCKVYGQANVPLPSQVNNYGAAKSSSLIVPKYLPMQKISVANEIVKNYDLMRDERYPNASNALKMQSKVGKEKQTNGRRCIICKKMYSMSDWIRKRRRKPSNRCWVHGEAKAPRANQMNNYGAAELSPSIVRKQRTRCAVHGQAKASRASHVNSYRAAESSLPNMQKPSTRCAVHWQAKASRAIQISNYNASASVIQKPSTGCTGQAKASQAIQMSNDNASAAVIQKPSTVPSQPKPQQTSQMNNYSAAESSTSIVPKCLNTHNISVANEIVTKHNDLRRDVNPVASNMLKMKWSKEAADNAAKWVAVCNFEHSTEEQRTISKCLCGENLAKLPGPMSWPEVIDLWYGEQKFFTHGVGGAHGKVTEHYTQIADAKSYYLGCAFALCADQYYYICHYCPRGNMTLVKPYTAGKPCSTCYHHCDAGLCTRECRLVDKAGNCAEMRKNCKDKTVSEYCQATCKC